MNDLIRKAKKMFAKLNSAGFMHLFGASSMNRVLSFVSGFLIIRIIPKTQYGVYANAENILSLFCLAEGFAMTTSFLQFGCTNTGQKKESIWSYCFWFSILFQLALSMIIALTAVFVPNKIAGTNTLLLLMTLLPLIRLIRDLQQVYLRTELEIKTFAASNTFSAVIMVVLSCCLSFVFYEKGLIAAAYISAAATVLFLTRTGKIPVPAFRNTLTRREKNKILRFSAVCLINNSTASIMYLLDTFVLGIVIASSTVTASYKVASKIPTALSFLPGCVMTFVYPYFAKHKHDLPWCRRNYKKLLLCFGGLNFAISIGLIVFAPLVISLVFGEQYADSVAPFRILCLNYAIQATFYNVSGQLLVSQEKLGFNTFTGFFASGLNTVFNLVLIPRYASVGAAIATTAVSAVAGFMSSIFMFTVLNKRRCMDDSDGKERLDDARQ